jgi:hypothetical protein
LLFHLLFIFVILSIFLQDTFLRKICWDPFSKEQVFEIGQITLCFLNLHIVFIFGTKIAYFLIFLIKAIFSQKCKEKSNFPSSSNK